MVGRIQRADSFTLQIECRRAIFKSHRAQRRRDRSNRTLCGERRGGRDGNAPRDHRERRTEPNEIRAEKLPENEDRENPKVSRVVLHDATGTMMMMMVTRDDIYVFLRLRLRL